MRLPSSILLLLSTLSARHVLADPTPALKALITPAPEPKTAAVQARALDDCDYGSVRDCEEQRWCILFRAPICRTTTSDNRARCSCSLAQAQSNCYVNYCRTAPDNVITDVANKCASGGPVSGGSASRSASRSSSGSGSRTLSASMTSRTSSGVAAARQTGTGRGLGEGLLVLGGLLAMGM